MRKVLQCFTSIQSVHHQNALMTFLNAIYRTMTIHAPSTTKTLFMICPSLHTHDVLPLPQLLDDTTGIEKPGSRVFVQSQLLQLNPWQNPHKHQNARHDGNPELNVQRHLIEIRLRRRADCHQQHDQHDIAAHSVILVHSLGVVNAAIDFGRVVLREADEGLQNQQDVRHQAKDGMDRLEVRVVTLVVDDDDQAGEQGEDAREVEDKVGIRTYTLLRRGVRWLEDENGLGNKEESSRVEELQRRTSSVLLGRVERGPRTGWAENSISLL